MGCYRHQRLFPKYQNKFKIDVNLTHQEAADKLKLVEIMKQQKYIESQQVITL